MKVVVFSGLPGTGKSTLAEALGRHLRIPVFAKDWLESALLRCEMVASTPEKPLGWAGYQLLTILAERQLMLGQSVILDSVAGTRTIRDSWKQLCEQYEAHWQVIECVCSDPEIHRARLSTRQRKIPGWYELQWSDVEKVKSTFTPWEEDRLTLDMRYPLEENLAQALAYCE